MPIRLNIGGAIHLKRAGKIIINPAAFAIALARGR